MNSLILDTYFHLRLGVILTLCLLLAACQKNTIDLNEGDTLLGESIIVSIGSTPIPNGEAIGDTDITVQNKYFALSFGVETPSPWGVARGGLLDIGIIRDGEMAADFLSLVDFMPNYWSAWPTTYQDVSIESNTPTKAVVLTRRDWGEAVLQTRFTIRADSNLVQLDSSIKNDGSDSLNDILSGFIAWPNGGQLHTPLPISSIDSRLSSEEAIESKWSASYNSGWALGLHAPFATWTAYGGRDRYLQYSLDPGEEKTFTAFLQIEQNADLSRIAQKDINFRDRESGKVFGTLTDSEGHIVDNSAIVIKQDGTVHSWALISDGQYEFSLPAGHYQLFPTAQNYAPGATLNLKVDNGAATEINFSDIKAPGTVDFSVMTASNEQPLDASISITKGIKPVIGYFGKSRFFTELEEKGRVQIEMAPGIYEVSISAGSGFFSESTLTEVEVISGKTSVVEIRVPILVNTIDRGWYSADLHHHSDVLDGFSEPEYVLRSQLASSLDFSFLSDHDSTQNNAELSRLSSNRGMGFIAGTEISASWAHFNAYPIDADKEPNPEIGTWSVDEIYTEARRLGADVIHVNHPFDNYGYFSSLEKEQAAGLNSGSMVPGGYNLNFDLIEITTQNKEETLRHVWELWNQGHRKYFAAGSDVHDVWNTPAEYGSGSARSFVFIDRELTVSNYIKGLKAGHSYASQGPIIFPDILFGTEIQHTSGTSLQLNFAVQAVSGLKTVTLIENGSTIEIKQYPQGNKGLTPIPFTTTPEKDGWYSLIVEDWAGKHAYSNPIWVDSISPNEY